MSYGPRAVRRKKRPNIIWPALALALMVIGAVVAVPSFLYVEKAPATRPDLVYKGMRQAFPVVVERGDAYVPFDFVKEVIDPDAFWDESGLVVVTTKDKVVKMETDSLTAYVNQHPVELQVPVILEDSEPYIPAATLETLYPLSTRYFPEEGVFIARRNDVVRDVGTARSDVVVRESPSFLARRVGVAPAGEEFDVYGSQGRWVRVETSQGLVGWMSDRDAVDRAERVPEVEPPKDYIPPSSRGGRIALTWEQVEVYTPDPAEIGPMDGLNVISPTWFRLGETPGEVENYADSRYVAWAHDRGYEVWALFSNSFDLQRTRTVLRSSDLRDQVIAQMLLYARMYSLDGVNLDFENVYHEDAPYLTQFVREFTPLLHEAGLTVSIDVTVKSLSPTWSMCYERSRLAEVVDYVMLMAYDEYWAGSPVAGPTASIPWTRWTVETTLEEVPAEKLVLGVPFYTRLWTETKNSSGSKVTQRALGMESANAWLRSEGVEAVSDQEAGLLYAQKTSGDNTYKMWLEDSESMAKRMHIAETYGLAGVAAWRRGFENPPIWDVIADYVNP